VDAAHLALGQFWEDTVEGNYDKVQSMSSIQRLAAANAGPEFERKAGAFVVFARP
jgi:hypothetical protein